MKNIGIAMNKKVIISEDQLSRIISEENLTKADVTKIVKDVTKQDRDFENRIKNIAADVVKNLFKVLWQKNGMYDNDIRH